ncbi:hypothetical protein DRH27_03965, partial [Candidatus Falkowbacteria bacterium]
PLPEVEENLMAKTMTKSAEKLADLMRPEKYIKQKEETEKDAVSVPERPADKEVSASLEEVIGGKWFAKIGIVVIILGVSFFLKYAFDNDWIGEQGRVILGVLSGIVVLGLGEKTIRKYKTYGQVVSGGGLALLYLSVYASFGFYHLVPQLAAFIFVGLVTGIGIALSLRYNALSLIGMAIFGGFLTPILISTGENNLVGLFSYVLLLDLAILAVSVFKKWRELNVLGFVGTAIIYLTWSGRFYSEDQLLSVMIFLSLFFVVYSISSLIYNLVKNEESTGTEQILTLVTGVAFFGTSYSLLNHDYHLAMAPFALVMAIYYFIWAYSVRSITPKDEKLFNFLAFLTVGFITLAIPIHFKQNIVTIGWIIEAVLLLYLGTKVNQRTIIVFGSTIASFVIFRLLFIDSGLNIGDSLVFFNKRFLTYVLGIIAFYLISYIFRNNTAGIDDKNMVEQLKKLMAVSLIVANFFTLFSISQELIVYHDKEIREIKAEQNRIVQQSKEEHGRDYYRYYYKDNEYLAIQEKINNINYRKSIALSLYWLFYAIVLLVIGFIGRYKAVRVGGILLLAVSIGKLFFYDLWSLGTLYRIISSISLGIVLMSISFIYQKYKDKIREII